MQYDLPAIKTFKALSLQKHEFQYVLQVAEPKIHRNLAVRFLSTSTKIGTTQIPIFLYKLLTLTTDLQSLQPSKQLNQNQSISSKKSSQSSSITPN